MNLFANNTYLQFSVDVVLFDQYIMYWNISIFNVVIRFLHSPIVRLNFQRPEYLKRIKF